jgi:hypothetical protein
VRVRVVDDAIGNGVSVGGIADQFVPFIRWDFAGDDCRLPPKFKVLTDVAEEPSTG